MNQLITIEGQQGAGKTTLTNNLIQSLNNLGVRYTTINEVKYEPSRTVVDKWRRSQLGQKGFYTPEVIHSFANARATFHQEVLQGIIDDHELVILDRSYITNCVYQLGNGLSYQEIMDIHMKAGVIPVDKAVILSCDPKLSFNRALSRNQQDYDSGGGYEIEGERFMVQPEPIELTTLRHDIYNEIAELHQSFHLIETDNKTPEEVTKVALDIIFAT